MRATSGLATHSVRRIACRRTTLRSAYSASDTASIDGAAMRAAALRYTLTGSDECNATTPSAIRATSSLRAAGARW